MTCSEILEHLRSLANPEAVAGMARFGISSHNTYGVSVPTLRQLARKIGKNHPLAQELWDSGVHEARILASMIDRPEQVAEEQMERWVGTFDSWDVCDQCCGNLLVRTALAYQKAVEWSSRPEEFVKRSGFVLMAELASHDRNASDEQLAAFFPIVVRESGDPRNFVKKAVNWALREIGQRSIPLNEMAVTTAREIQQLGSKPGRWIAADALRDLTGESVQTRLRTGGRWASRKASTQVSSTAGEEG
ncbi:MAG: DNA alkylation repair protein [Chloroflexi bacterium]|nr:DNA alkylation repair protein [Chloroflexota bacterium]